MSDQENEITLSRYDGSDRPVYSCGGIEYRLDIYRNRHGVIREIRLVRMDNLETVYTARTPETVDSFVGAARDEDGADPFDDRLPSDETMIRLALQDAGIL